MVLTSAASGDPAISTISVLAKLSLAAVTVYLTGAFQFEHRRNEDALARPHTHRVVDVVGRRYRTPERRVAVCLERERLQRIAGNDDTNVTGRQRTRRRVLAARLAGNLFEVHRAGRAHRGAGRREQCVLRGHAGHERREASHTAPLEHHPRRRSLALSTALLGRHATAEQLFHG